MQLHQNEGYLFGGYYTSKISNPVTNTMTCPRFFYSLHMGEDTKVCVSTDYERGSAYAVDFAGFESCLVGNPLAHMSPTLSNQNQWPHYCPHGYAQHLVTVEDGCEINFCVRAGAFKPNTIYAPKLPPFRKHPKYKSNVTEALVMFGVYGQVWVKNDQGKWEKIRSGKDDGRDLLSSFDRNLVPMSDESLPSGSMAAISLSVIFTVFAGVAICALIMLGRKVYKLQKTGKSGIADGEGANCKANPITSAEPV